MMMSRCDALACSYSAAMENETMNSAHPLINYEAVAAAVSGEVHWKVERLLRRVDVPLNWLQMVGVERQNHSSHHCDYYYYH